MTALNLPTPPDPQGRQYQNSLIAFLKDLYNWAMNTRGLIMNYTASLLQGIQLSNSNVVIGTVQFLNAGSGLTFTISGSTGTISGATFVPNSISTGLTALSGGAAGALALVSQINVVTTVGSGNGVILPLVAAGTVIRVINRGANTLKVYPPTGQQIEALGNNVASGLAVNGDNSYVAADGLTQWYV